MLREFMKVFMAVGIFVYFFTQNILVNMIDLDWLHIIPLNSER